MRRGRLSLTLLLTIDLWSCKAEPPGPKPVGQAESIPATTPDPVVARAAVDDPATCAPCHAAVVQEWNQSMHAQAHSSRDPIYGAMLAAHIKKKGPGVAKACAQCHGPRAVDTPQGAVAQQGVNCASCHAVASLKKGARGAAALVWTANDALLGPHDATPTGSPAHGTGPAPAHMKDGATLCLACHGAMENGQGAAVCTTGPEWTKGGTEPSCISCHMPLIDAPSGSVSELKTHRSHRFIGPRGTWGTPEFKFVASALDVTGVLTERLEVSVSNKALHAVPTGFPGRVVTLVAEGFDADGGSVWTSKPTMFNKVYLDAKGKPTMPAFAESLGQDNRLRPGETRKLTFKVPTKVSKVTIRLGYRLMPPPAAKALELTDSPLAGLNPIMQVQVTRSP